MTPPISIQDLLRDTTQTQQPQAPVSIFDLMGQDEEQPYGFGMIGNRMRNLWKLYKVATGTASGDEWAEVGRAAVNAEGTAPGAFKKIGRDLINTLAYYGKKPTDPNEPPSPSISEALQGVTAEGIASGVFDVFSGLVSKPIEGLFGVGLDRTTLYGMTPEERAQAIKDAAANTAMFVVGGAAGRAVTGATVGKAARAITASQGTAGAIKAGTEAITKAGGGRAARILTRGTVEGAAGGATQAAISRMGESDMGTQVFMNGILFAPLGVAFEVARMTRPSIRGSAAAASKVDVAGRQIAALAGDVAMTRQLQIGMKDSFADILFKLEGLENSNHLGEALVRGKFGAHPDKPMIVPGVSAEAFPSIVSAIAKGETKIVPQFYQRPDGLYDMLITGEGRLSNTAIRSFRDTGLLPNQLVDHDGVTYRFRASSKDGKRVFLTNVESGKKITVPRGQVRMRSDLETHDVSPRVIIDQIWDDFRAYMIADAEGQPAPRGTTGLSPVGPAGPPSFRTVPSFIQRATSAVGRFLRDESGTLRIAETGEELLFSRVERTVEAAQYSGNKAQGKEWLAKLTKSSPLFEREWTGLEQWLKDNAERHITKEEMLAKVRENQIEVEEVVFGGRKYQEAHDEYTAARQAFYDLTSQIGKDVDNWQYYQDPYYLNPVDRAKYDAARARLTDAQNELDRAGNRPKYGDEDYREPGGKNYREILLLLGGEKLYTGKHFGETDNVLAWTRLQDFVMPNGEKLTFVDEVQSDWFQDMVEEGVRPPIDKVKLKEKKDLFDTIRKEYDKVNDQVEAKMREVDAIYNNPDSWNYKEDQWGYSDRTMKPEVETEYNRINTEIDNLNYKQRYALEDAMDRLGNEIREIENPPGVPDAPFKKKADWVSLILKRIIAEAAISGSDRIAFSTPILQYLRWGSDILQWRRIGDEGFEMYGTQGFQGPFDADILDPNSEYRGYNSRMYGNRTVKTKEELQQVVKDSIYKPNEKKVARITEKVWAMMQEQPEGKYMPRYSGMENFYSEVLPNTLKDLGKKLGIKVDLEPVRLPQLSGKEAVARLAGLTDEEVFAAIEQGFTREELGRIAHTPEGRRLTFGSKLAVPTMKVPSGMRERTREGLPLGAASPALVGATAAAGAGGLVGLATGDTPEERTVNSILYGLGAGAAVLGGARALSRPRAAKPAPPVKPLGDVSPRSSYQNLIDRFSAERGYSAQERAVLEREMAEKLFKESMNELVPEERMVVDRLMRSAEQELFKPGGSRLEQAQIAAKATSQELVRKANSNGMLVDEELGGNLVLRDFASHRVLGRFKKTTDALEFIDKSGQADGVDLDGGNSNALPPRIASGLMPIDGGPDPLNTPYAARPNGAMGSLTDLVNTVGDWVTPNRNILTSLDSAYGTEFFSRVYDPTQVARLKADAAIKPWYEKLSRIDKLAVKMKVADREEVRAYLETESPDEIKAHGGPGGRPLNETEIRLAEDFASKNVDLARVQKYLMEAERLAKEVDAGKLTDADALTVLKQMANDMGLDANHLEAATIIRNIRTGRDAFVGPIAKLTNAILNNSQSRADFASSRGMSGQQLRMAMELDELHRELSRAFGVPDVYRLQDLMAHSRLYFEGNVEAALNDFDMPPAVKDLYTAAARVGEIASHEKDPIRSLQRYIKAGFDARIMAPALAQAKQAIPDELAKLPAETRGKAEKMVSRYLSDVQGIPAEASQFTQVGVAKFLNNLGLKIPINVREDIVNLILATGEAAMQGFRVVAGLRDFTQGVIWYYSRFGAKRTLDMMEYGTKGLNGVTKGDLQRAGVVPDLDVLFFTTPTEFTGTTLGQASNVVGRSLRKVSQVGLKMSGQKDVYAMFHAGAYLDTWQKAGDVLTKLSRGEMDKAKAYKKLLIDTYELPAIKEFDRLVSEGKIDDAARLLARETAREQVGTFGSGNNPGGWHRNLGRIAGQYGSWSMWFRAQLMRSLSRGSYGQRGGALLRLAAGQAALYGASQAMGINLQNWYAPTGALFTGGPLVDAALTAAEAMNGFGPAQDMAQARLRRYLPYDPWSEEFNIGQIYIPGSYFINDLYQAYQMSQEGDPMAPARAIGIRPAVE